MHRELPGWRISGETVGLDPCERCFCNQIGWRKGKDWWFGEFSPPSTADPWEQMVVGAGAGMPLEATAGGRRQESPVFHW